MFFMHLMCTYFHFIMCSALSLSSPSINLIKIIPPCWVQTLGWSEWAGRGAGEWKCVIYKLCSQRRSEADTGPACGEPELGQISLISRFWAQGRRVTREPVSSQCPSSLSSRSSSSSSSGSCSVTSDLVTRGPCLAPSWAAGEAASGGHSPSHHHSHIIQNLNIRF